MENNKRAFVTRPWIVRGSKTSSSDSNTSKDNNNLATYAESIALDKPCIILLGTPGMGKSTEFHHAHSEAVSKGYRSQFISLASIYTESDLNDALIDESLIETPNFIFLDALDETPVTVPVIQQWILRAASKLSNLEKKSGTKTFLRISSRSADWSEQFEKQLENIWGEGSVHVFELTSFSKDEAMRFINAIAPELGNALGNNIDESTEAITSLPVTLKMLVNNYLVNGSISLGDKSTTYQRGVLALLEDSNKVRRANGASGNLDLNAKFIIAGRIAAASELSTKSVIWDGLQSEIAPKNALSINELAGGVESVNGKSIEVTVKDIRETLRTGLFKGGEFNTFEWVHKTFSEFLAATYIQLHSKSVESILSLIRSPIPGNTNIVPQLREVAAWLSTFNHNVWLEIVSQDPALLLSSDVALTSGEDRRLLVEELLLKVDTLEIYEKHEWRQFYSRLKHNELATQLAPFISDVTKNNSVRRLAIEISVACTETELIEELKVVAFNPLDNDHIRSVATYALTILLKDGRILELLPLLNNLQGDANDEIKGCLLEVLWPNHISFSQLICSLTERKNQTLIGSYSLFLYSLKIPTLTPEDAVIALNWLSEALPNNLESSTFSYLIPKLLIEVWKCAYDQLVLTTIAKFVLDSIDSPSRWRYETDLKDFQIYYSSDAPNRRRSLIMRVFQLAFESTHNWKNVRSLLFTPWQLVTPEDSKWLTDELIENPEKFPEEWFIDLIISSIRWENSDDASYVLDQSKNNLALTEALSSFSFISFDSELAKWSRRKKHEFSEDEEIKSSQIDEIASLLKQCESNAESFWRLNLALLADSSNRLNEFTGVLAPSVGWNLLSRNDQERVIKAAYKYLCEFKLGYDFLQPNNHNRAAAAAYRAFRLLKVEASDIYEKIPAAVWGKWCLSIISFMTNDGEAEKVNQREVARKSFNFANPQFISALSTFLAVTNSAYHAINLCKGWANDAIFEIFWNWLRNSTEEGLNQQTTFEVLVSADFQPAINLGANTLESIATTFESENFSKDIHRSATILASHPEKYWPILGKLVNEDKKVAKPLLIALANSKADKPNNRISEVHEAQLYLWIESVLDKPSRTYGVRMVSAEDRTFDFQEAILRKLITSGTSASVTALKWIAEQLPDNESLKLAISDAKDNQRRFEWAPLSPRAALEQIVGNLIEQPLISDKEQIIDIAERSLKEVNPPVNFAEKVSESIAFPKDQPTEVELTFEPCTYLLVSTEWGSSHGGVSTFNRNLCIALAEFGHTVYCFIPNADNNDIERAAKYNVVILVANKYPGLDIEGQLARGPVKKITPDIVIGHDHITGVQALALAREEYRCPYIHLIHTSPEVLEPFKDRQPASISKGITYSHGNQKRVLQNQLSLESDMVLAVGSQLESSIRTSLAGRKAKELIQSILPGLNEELVDFNGGDPAFDPLCLTTGRLNDATIKGVDLYLKVANDFYLQQNSVQMRRTRFILRGMNNMDDEMQRLLELHNVKSPNINCRPYTIDEVELMDDLRSAALFLMPSRTEGFGLAGLEAISAGIPVLISSESGLGATLLSLAQEFPSSDLRRIATECVIDSQPDTPHTVQQWSKQAAVRLADIPKSFTEANDLRSQLKTFFDWQKTAKEVTKIALDLLKK